MSMTVEAIYENGVLKLDHPLPFQERARVVVHVNPKTGRIRQHAGLLRWTGDVEVLRKIAEAPECGVLESP